MSMIFPPELDDLQADLAAFEERLQKFSQRLGLNPTDLDVDHVAVRCHQNATAERWQKGFCNSGSSSRRR